MNAVSLIRRALLGPGWPVRLAVVGGLAVATLTTMSRRVIDRSHEPNPWDRFDLERCLQHAELASDVYEPPRVSLSITQPDLLAEAAPAQIQSQTLITEPYRLGVLIRRDDRTRTQWIAARGTANAANLRASLSVNTTLDPILGVRVHRGFSRAADEVWRTIASLQTPMLRAEYDTHLTGHSLGGAVALLLALRMEQAGYRIASCVTFGQPRVLGTEGARRYGDRPVLRVVNDRDPIPYFPASLSAGGYRHVGAVLRLFDEKRFGWAGPAMHAAVPGWAKAFAANDSLPMEHGAELYARRLRQLAELAPDEPTPSTPQTHAGGFKTPPAPHPFPLRRAVESPAE